MSRGGFSTWLVFDDTIPFSRPTYLTDVQCGFCRGHMARVQSWFPGTFDAVDFRQAPLAELGLTQEEADAAGHLVVPVGDGVFEVWAGHLSWAAVLQVQPRWWARVAGRVLASRLVTVPAAAVYRWVARNRSHLPGGQPTCQVKP